MIHRAIRTSWVHRLACPAFALLLAGNLLAVNRATAEVPPQSNIINENLRKTWSDNKLVAAKPATPNEFVRRAFIDILGRIPTADEVREYENDQSSDRRAKLIHRLLYTETWKVKDALGSGKPITMEYTAEYAKHWADVWEVWLMTRSGTNMQYHDEIGTWLYKQFANNVAYDKIVRDLLTAEGQWNKNPAVNFIMAHLGEKNAKGNGKKKAKTNEEIPEDGQFDAVPITSRVTRLFLGIQTQCTQCHDHPFNPEWGQENFWGVNAFFRQVIRTNDPTPVDALRKKKDKKDPVMEVSVTDDPQINQGMRIYYERRSGVLMSIKPSFLPNLADLEKDKGERVKKTIPAEWTKSRRAALADFVIEHDNFAKAYVNRMWAHFFGRGMNEQPTPDDFGGHNKLLHPQMLEQLGQEFIKYRYDPKALIEWICNSEAYNLSYVAANKDMAKPEFDAFFTHMPLKSMSPEVLFESLATATKTDMAVDKEQRREDKKTWMSKLVNNFGDDEGNEMTFNGTIVQALMLLNGKELNEEIRRKDGFIAKAMARTGGNGSLMVNEIYLTALGRRPSANIWVEESTMVKGKKVVKQGTRTSEFEFVRGALKDAASNYDVKGSKDGKGGVQHFYEDLFWSLLNTSEFMLNH